MPPKENKDGKKQVTLLGFFNKSAASNSATPAKAAASQSALKSSASSASTVAPTPESKRVREPSKAITSSSPPPAKSSSSTAGENTDPIDVDVPSGDESEPVTAKKKKPLKRKVITDDEGEGSDEDADLEKFSLRLSQFKKPAAGRSASGSNTGSEASSTTSRGQRAAKKRRTSNASRDEDDFIAPSDEEEDDEPPARSRTSSMSGSRSGMDVDSEEDDDEPVKKKSSKAKGGSKASRAPARPSAAGAANSSTNLFMTDAERKTMTEKQDKKANEECYSFLKNIRDADEIPEGEPGYNPRTLYVPDSAWKSFTPFEKQFWEIKRNYWDTVLFFQKGKFYELYENDAQIGHQLFDLKLTDRVKMKMVGVPEYAFDLWASKFLAKGYKVGKVEQAETMLGAEMRMAAEKEKGGKAKAKAPPPDKIVRRELRKVLTNGTLVDANMLQDDQAGHCLAIREVEDEDNFGLCVLDAATGEFNLCSFVDDVCRTKLETMMRQLRPKELGNLSVATIRLLKNILPASCLWTTLRDTEGYDYDGTLKALEETFPAGDENAMEEDDVFSSNIPEGIRQMMDSRVAIEAIGAMIWLEFSTSGSDNKSLTNDTNPFRYLRQLNIDKDLVSMKNFNIYDPMKQGQGLVLDGQTLSHVEVLQNSEGTDEGSLLRLLSRCVTPFGKRLFRIWLCMPLREVSAINARLDAVEDLLDAPTAEAEFGQLAKGLPDLERIVSRIHAGTCKILDFLKVLQAFEKLSKGLKKLEDEAQSFKSTNISGLLRSAPDLDPHINALREQFVEPKEKDDLLLPQDGKNEAYDTVEAEITGLKVMLDRSLKKLAGQTGLKLEYWHSSIGTKDIYLVQAPASAKKVPKEWVKSAGTKAVTRYQVPELQTMIRSFKEAQETRNAAIRDFKAKLYSDFDADRDVWLRAVRVMAELDCLFSLAKSSAAIGEPSCRPEFVESDEAFVEFEQLRHPALCLKDDFIPNDVKMGKGCDTPGIMLLTGANMAGKSTVMRMTAAGVIMAQMGMHVPAKSARISPVDKILTRMGAYDNMFSNASTFRVEMDEACKILREATPKSLVILDELGRGTSTFDGMAIAGAVLHQLATHTLGLALFATHYSSLTQDFAYHPNIRNMHMKTAVDDEKRELVFLYKLTEGTASSSFGTHVASLAGVPQSVVARAEAISTDFADKFHKKLEAKRTSNLPLVAQADFAYLWKLAQGQIGVEGDPTRMRRVIQLIGQSAKEAYLKV
ncbi:DNA mismatch repair protein msh6 [Tulasnella sp. 425]|nr:DNA mismatch repair protein msh6 [Tulasnella sp. 425]